MDQPVPPRLTIDDSLDQVRRRPAMYLGRKSLRDLASWLHGYRHALFAHGLLADGMEDWFHSFDEFVQDRYDWHDVGGWAGKIAYRYWDDDAAFDEFFRLLDEFRAARAGNRLNPTDPLA